MKGAFIISTDEELYEQVERILVDRGGRAADDHTVQISGTDNSLFTVFGDLGEEFAADLAQGADETRGNIDPLPSFSASTSCWAECGSEEAFVEWIGVIAGSRKEPTWVLDGDGVLWTSAALDPAEVRL